MEYHCALRARRLNNKINALGWSAGGYGGVVVTRDHMLVAIDHGKGRRVGWEAVAMNPMFRLARGAEGAAANQRISSARTTAAWMRGERERVDKLPSKGVGRGKTPVTFK
jgi:hypothetical protein